MIDFDNDRQVLGLLLLLALAVMVILFTVGPCYQPAMKLFTPKAKAVPTAIRSGALPKPRPTPVPRTRPTPRPDLPTPVPTPPGGGFRKIVFSSTRADGHYIQIYIMDADGQNVERLTRSQSYDRDPHLSSNGRDIAFVSNRQNGVYQIFLLDLETRSLRQLTHSDVDITNPVWSPDNGQILFTSHNGHTPQLGIMNADGTDARPLTSNYSDNHGYSFSPDGHTIAFVSDQNGQDEIFTMDLKTRETKLLLASDDNSRKVKPAFSPQGHLLAFASDVVEHKLKQLYLFNLDTGSYYRISQDPLDHNTPFISPDGSKIAYTALWRNAWNIFTMDIDGRHVRNLTQSDFDNFSPTWR